MKILHIYKDYYPVLGGIENHIRMLAEAQAALGHEVTVLVHSRDRHTHIENMNNVRVVFAARWLTLSSTPVGIALPQWVRREAADIAHLHFPYPWGEVANYLFGRARRTVITYHSDIIRQKYMRVLYRPLMFRVLGRADHIIATSPNYVRSSPVLQRFADKCVIVPLGIDPTPFECPNLTRAKEIRAKANVPADGMLLLFVGLLRYYKGLQYLLRAMADTPDVHLLVVGSGPMEEAWRRLTQELGISGRVHFDGAVSSAALPSYYAASDAFVLPASERSEAFGVVQLEAMAAGKPVVSTEVGTGTSYVNVNGETGLVVPSRDAGALAAAIQRLAQDKKMAERMGAAGRVRVREGFTNGKMVEKIGAVYENLIFSSR